MIPIINPVIVIFFPVLLLIAAFGIIKLLQSAKHNLPELKSEKSGVQLSSQVKIFVGLLETMQTSNPEDIFIEQTPLNKWGRGELKAGMSISVRPDKYTIYQYSFGADNLSISHTFYDGPKKGKNESLRLPLESIEITFIVNFIDDIVDSVMVDNASTMLKSVNQGHLNSMREKQAQLLKNLDSSLGDYKIS